MKKFFIAQQILVFFLLPLHAQFVPGEWVIPVKGNSFITQENPASTHICTEKNDAPLSMAGRAGIILKNDTLSVASTYIYIPAPCSPRLSLNIVGLASLTVTCGQDKFNIDVDTPQNQRIDVGKLNITTPQYIRIDFRMRNIGKPSFIAIHDVILSEMKVRPLFISKNFNPDFGLRGASVYLYYDFKPDFETEWAYSEIQVPADGDIAGSNYCIQGFDGGFLCLQNIEQYGPSVLFAVWDIFDPANPKKPGQEATLVSKADDVKIIRLDFHTFGKGCVLPYRWKTNETYKCLIHATHPDIHSTDYTAYFLAPETGNWQKIATLRSKDSTGIAGLYSFIENAYPSNGFLSRKAFYKNTWYMGHTDQQWYPVTSATLSSDDTGRRGVRVDYEGGLDGQSFYLQTGGFLSKGVKRNGTLTLPPLAQQDSVQMSEWLQQQTEKILSK